MGPGYLSGQGFQAGGFCGAGARRGPVCHLGDTARTTPKPYVRPQDVESYDPVLNPVLNREVRRTGGRVLITLGDQDIDLSPSFVIFLSTRDPTVRTRPFACENVTVLGGGLV